METQRSRCGLPHRPGPLRRPRPPGAPRHLLVGQRRVPHALPATTRVAPAPQYGMSGKGTVQ
eukprot:2021509-Lingulodinium_polyedra.AAC.1